MALLSVVVYVVGCKVRCDGRQREIIHGMSWTLKSSLIWVHILAAALSKLFNLSVSFPNHKMGLIVLTIKGNGKDWHRISGW